LNARGLQLLGIAALCFGANGCWLHRTKVAPQPPPLPPTTVALVPAPEPATPPQIPTVPLAATPLPTKPVQPRVKKPKKVEPADSGAPVQMASAVTPAPPDANLIGSLTAGGAAAPAEQVKAAEAITAVEKRLGGLPASTLEAQKDGVTRVRSFLRQAHEALNSGDADGALTLATKAKVLLDDLLK
jgi:type IV secretory pathway VirB10-like protein